ncbi:MAG: tetratricopeptide repeat protein [Kiritimatiellia bacterium]
MEEITLEQIPRKTRDLYEKAMAALERGNAGYALDMLKQVIAVEPRFALGRKNLRIAQVKALLATKPNAMTHQMASLKGTFTLMGAQGKLKKDPKAALDGAEKLLALDPLNMPFLKFFAQAAEAAEMPELAVQTLEIAKPYYAKDVAFLRLLARLYIATNQPGGAKDCYAAVAELLPNDQLAIKNLKDAAALDTMKAGGWNDMKSDFRSKLKDKKEAILLEQQAKSVKGDSDVDSLIAERLKDIQREPQNMNFRRALADLYVRAERYDEALQTLDDATQAAGRSDPQIERTSSQIKTKKFDAAIAAAKEAGDEAAAAAQEQAKAEFLYADAVEMVRRYPNDLQFRYELGYQYYLRKQYNEAIEEFQLAQRNPQRRTRALYYLALCFREKGQPDIAFEQLQKAASELTLMDETKKDVVYEMGVLSEQMGRQAEAVAFFKEIYSVDIKYRDIAKRIESSYQKK